VAADKQFADARKALELIESRLLAPGKFVSYGDVCEGLGYERSKHARHVGQVCSLIDAACFWAKLPFLSAEKVRTDIGEYNPDSFSGIWEPYRQALIENASTHVWTMADIGKIRSVLNHMNGEGALMQWERIEGFGQAGIDRALSHK
jgi:hypothetical protein